MAFLTEAELRNVAKERLTKAYASSAERLIKSDDNKSSFDVFLSHSFKDAEVILGLKTVLEQQGLTVYVDWVVDSSVDRSKVTAATADHLRTRMKQSKSLIYAHSNNSTGSKWMPWELGYFDGYGKPIAVCPIVQSSNDSFKGEEFLGLYPYIDGTQATLWINKGNAPQNRLGAITESYLGLKAWMKSQADVTPKAA